MISCLILGPICIAPPYAHAADQDSVLAGLPVADAEALIKSVRRVRDSEYGSVHYQVDEVIERDNSESVLNKIEFWSLENRYFRIDISHYSDAAGESLLSQERFIVRPEGFAALQSKGDSEQFVVTTYGNLAKGMDRILAMPTVHASTRAYSILTIEDTLKNEYSNGGTRSLSGYEKEDQKLRWGSKYVSGPTKIACEITCDIENGVCTHYESKTTKDEEVASEVLVNRTFDYTTYRSIPASETVEIRRPETPLQTERRKITFVDWSPVDIEIFDIGLQARVISAGSPWTRRIFAFVTGTVMVGGWLFLRRRRLPTAEA